MLGLPRPKTLLIGGLGAAAGEIGYRFLIKEGPDDATGFITIPTPNPDRFDIADALRYLFIVTGVVVALRFGRK